MRSRVLSTILSVVLLILALVEFYPKTILPYQDTGDVPAIYETLAELPHGPVAEYPLLPAEEPLAYVYLVGQLTHLNPLVFGSQADSEGDKLRLNLLNPSDGATISYLASSGVKYLIIHKDSYSSGSGQKYPKDYNGGVVPEINSSQAKLITCQEEKCLYKIETSTKF